MFSRVTRAALSLAAATLLASCGSQQNITPAAAPAPAASRLPALAITDPWVKTAGKGMTAAFGTLVNNTDAAVTVVSGSTPLTPMVELHEVVESKGKMVMQPKKGGFVIPAHGSHVLRPGGDHIMLMDVTEAVKPGAEVPFTLALAGGGTFAFTALGKDFAGAKENYQPGMKTEDSDG